MKEKINNSLDRKKYEILKIIKYIYIMISSF